MVDEAGWRAHDPRVIELDREVGWIVSACLSGAWVLGTLLLWLGFEVGNILAAGLGILWMPFTAAVIALSYHWPAREYRHARYRLTPERIEIERGVFWRASVFVPRSRVQHLKVSRGPLERRHGLSTLTIYTAGTLHSAVPLRGLAEADAIHLRDELLPRTRTADGV